jgi:predicted dehydrogenase
MTIKVGIAGVRGLSTLMGFNSIVNTKVEALCDLDENLLNKEAKKYNIPKTYRVFEDMLESDIDAVVIATPMQCHVPQAIAALEAGKHVMSEVSAGVTMDELWWLLECVEKYKKVYMMAENYCYIPENQLIKSMVEKGLFGEVYFGEGEYLHDLKNLTIYNYGKHTNGKTSWRKYWQLGKRGAFYPTHSLGPVLKWFEGDHIKSVSCFGTGQHTAPEFRQEDTSLTICQMESGKIIKICLGAAIFTDGAAGGSGEQDAGICGKFCRRLSRDSGMGVLWRPACRSGSGCGLHCDPAPGSCGAEHCRGGGRQAHPL